MFDPNEKLINKIKERGGFINAHAHFDRAFTVTEANMEEDYLRNIVSAMRAQIDYGVSGALTFVDVDTVCNFKALEAVQEAKRLYKDNFNLKVCSQALKGVIKPKENKLLREALELDYLDAIGGLPRADQGMEQAHLDVEIFFQMLPL